MPIEKSLRIHGRKTEHRFIPYAKLLKAVEEAAEEKMRVLAEEARNLLIDRLYGAVPQPPAQAIVPKPPRLTSGGILRADREPFDHAPLSEATVDRKASEGLDGRPLVATGDYTYGIEVAKIETENKVSFVVRPQIRAHKGNPSVPLEKIAAIHEFGSASYGIPARPHWRPVLRQVREKFRQLGPKLSAEALRLALRMMK